MKVFSNAKLNLYLNVTGKRGDGYHLLNMINVPIDIYDEMDIEFVPGDGGLEQSFTPEVSCRPERTTIYKAFNVIKELLPAGTTARVKVKKNIPEGSGMGGGSSNAAFFIKSLAGKYNIPIDDGFLENISKNVGADVPFFMLNKPAWLEGIGEQIYAYNAFPVLNFLVIVPNFGISTAWAYSLVKIKLTKNADNISLKNSEIARAMILNAMKNDLEAVAEKEYTEISEMKKFLRSSGAMKAMMTGSGSAVFGIFENMEDVNKASISAKKAFPQYKVFSCKTIGA